MGAMIIRSRRPISFGWNDIDKTHPHMCRLHIHKKQHAEHNAINKARHKHDIKGATMVVYGENREGSCLAKPCEYCQEILKDYGIKKVIYSTPEGYDVMYL